VDPSDPPQSTNYDLYPGFQYSLDAGSSGDVDNAIFALAFGSISTDANYNILCDFDQDAISKGTPLTFWT
jgi:hypothetical protein